MRLTKKENEFILDLLNKEIEYAETNIIEIESKLNKSKTDLNDIEKNKLNETAIFLNIEYSEFHELQFYHLYKEIIKSDKKQIKKAKKLISKLETTNEIESK